MVAVAPAELRVRIRTLSRMLHLVAIPASAAVVAAASLLLAPPPAKEPLPVARDAAKEKSEGFAPLFNGTDLDGWIGDTKGYKVEDGAIVCQPGGTNLFTKDEYGDFELRFEFMLTPGANNGIALRAPTTGDPAYAGFESQVLDNGAAQYKDLKDWQYHGSLYGVTAATASAQRPVGEWNQETIVMKGSKVRIELNGVVIVDVDLAEVAKDGKTQHGKPVDGLTRAKGHIGFCGHGDRVAYRAVRIRKLG